MSFIEKYTPKCTADFIGNVELTNDIRDWIYTFKEATTSLKKNGLLKKNTKGRKKGTSKFSEIDKKHSEKKGNLLLLGDHGTGKTTLINLILKEINFHKLPEINFNGKCEVVITQIKNLTSMYKNQVLVIDEFDFLIQAAEKKNVDLILKMNNYERFIPIIILSNGHHTSKLTATKKMTNTMSIMKYNKADVKTFLFNICKIEKININYMYLDPIVDSENGDFRKLLMFLEELGKNFNGLKINKSDVEEYLKIVQAKDCKKDLFTMTRKIMTDNLNAMDCLKCCLTDYKTIPLTMYENYYKILKADTYFSIMSKFSYSDIIENYIYSDQNWDLKEIVNILNCVVPAYYINLYKTTMNINLKYALDRNKTSIRKSKIKKNVGNNSIEEFIYTME